MLGVGVLIVLLLWFCYLSWDNPGGDPQGSMFRGIEELVLWVFTFIVAVVAFIKFRRGP